MAKPIKQTNSKFVSYISKKRARKDAHKKRLASNAEMQVEMSERQQKKMAREAKLAEFAAANAKDVLEEAKLNPLNRSKTGGTTLGDALSHTMWKQT